MPKLPAKRKTTDPAPVERTGGEAVGYAEWLVGVKEDIRRARIKASVAVHSGLIRLYWRLGERIAELHAKAEWGSGFFRTFSADLRREFPDSRGFSESNLRYIARWHDFYVKSSFAEILHQLGEEFAGRNESAGGTSPIRHQVGDRFAAAFQVVPWRHHVEILTHARSPEEAAFFIGKTVENNWSRAVLLNFLDTDLFKRQGKAVTNFPATLPSPSGDLAADILKDPCDFDFLSLSEAVREKELEDALVRSITDFLLELGSGFAYVGRQIELDVNGDVVRPDLLFYHLGLRCFVVVELKVVPAAPPPVFEDTESATNAPLGRAMATARILRCEIALTATPSNSVEVAFGRDEDGDGALGEEEPPLRLGWDCGAWFLEGGTNRCVTADDPATQPARLALFLRVDEAGVPVSLTVSGASFTNLPARPPRWLFSRDWNVARLAVRGLDPRDESVSVQLDADGSVLLLR